MTEYTTDELAELIAKPIPGGGTPAIWWVTTAQAQMDAYDRWSADYDAHLDRIKALAESIGLGNSSIRVISYGTSTSFIGFEAHYGYKAPDGWRIDQKGRVIPSRKTKAHRESEANRQFAELEKIPHVRSYVSGLPAEIYLDDRDFGGTSYGVNYRRGEKCVWAYCFGDPDRSPDRRDNGSIDTDVWHRQKLSALLQLREMAVRVDG